MFHFPKTRKEYKKHLHPASCPFCHITKDKDRTLIETEHAYIVPNITFYDLWEARDVEDHLLVVPKRHVRSLSELSAAERAGIMDILAEYEAKNYNVYARAVDSTMRSVKHQHTHLIKTNPKEHRGTFFMRKPYIFFKF
jgi:diadenosine tetraphosphate (Ap4A) HIT family hydrolase